jgi:hypothetical protein
LLIIRFPSEKVLSGLLFCSVRILPGRRSLIRYPPSPNDVLLGLSSVGQDVNPQVSGFCLVCSASGSCRDLPFGQALTAVSLFGLSYFDLLDPFRQHPPWVICGSLVTFFVERLSPFAAHGAAGTCWPRCCSFGALIPTALSYSIHWSSSVRRPLSRLLLVIQRFSVGSWPHNSLASDSIGA